MPIEIRELIIKATITEESGKENGPAAGSRETKRPDKQFMQDIVEQVMELIRLQKER